ncbi:MAG TPA: hypothetical protein VH083_10825 [Myxococcales bacterium]|nr:hypothetical protein [Myxococcales bacterium]
MRRLLLALLLLSGACGGGADTTGVVALLRVSGAQYVQGPMPQPSGGPLVVSASINRNVITPGLTDRVVNVTTPPGSTGVLLGLQGDTGYWILPAGAADPQQSNQQKLSVPVAFSSHLPSGQFTIAAQAVSPAGAAGQPALIGLQTDDTGPAAALAFNLSWDTEADLDLHVVDPKGTEIYWGHIVADGGLLDFDSNQSCILDGRRREIVAWASAPPSGNYLVRVDTPSLCTAATAHWMLTAQLNGALQATIEGQSTSFDTRGFHTRSDGLLVLELVVP